MVVHVHTTSRKQQKVAGSVYGSAADELGESPGDNFRRVNAKRHSN